MARPAVQLACGTYERAFSSAELAYSMASLSLPYRNNREINTQKPKTGYIDYVRSIHEGFKDVKTLNYWLRKLDGANFLLNLPMSKKRPLKQSYKGGNHVYKLNNKISSLVKSNASNNNATVYMVMMALLNTLMFKYTKQKDIIIGSPISNRNSSELDDVVGFFVNNLVIRTVVDVNSTFSEFVKIVRGNILDDYTHQNIPFDHLVDELKLDRDLSYHPCFQIMLGYLMISI